MFIVRWDVKNPRMVRMPENDGDIVVLADKFIAYESGLPVEAQVKEPGLEPLRKQTELTRGSIKGATGGEAKRAEAAETLRLKLSDMYTHLDEAIAALKYRYFKNLATLENWGLDTVSGTNGVTVRKPDSEKGWIEFLNAYVEREETLPVEQRIVEPSFEVMDALNTTIQNTVKTRDSGTSQRQTQIESRSDTADLLLAMLQTSAAALILRAGVKVTKELTKWGFEVVEPEGEEQEKAEGEATPEGTKVGEG